MLKILIRQRRNTKIQVQVQQPYGDSESLAHKPAPLGQVTKYPCSIYRARRTLRLLALEIQARQQVEPTTVPPGRAGAAQAKVMFIAESGQSSVYSQVAEFTEFQCQLKLGLGSQAHIQVHSASLA